MRVEQAPAMLLLASASVLACRLDSSGRSTSSNVEDTAIDTGVEPMDTNVVIDTGTEPMDTDMDTGVVDTTVIVEDVGVPLLSVSGMALTAGSSINLSTEGTLDWAHFGLSTATSREEKATGALLGAWTTTPAPAGQFGGYPITFIWSDGAPTLTASTSAGLFQTAVASTFSVEALAATTVRTLRVYVTTDDATANVRAKLSGDGGPMFSTTLPVGGTPAGGGHHPQLIKVEYSTPAKAATVTLSIEKTSATGSINLLAASLQ